MYLDFFGLAEKPFSQTPDPRFLYWNDSYREALASLRYGIQERKGFLTFIGEAGTGKTTLLRKLLEDLGPDVLSVFLFNPDVGFDEILQYTLGELGIACPTQRRLDMLQRLNEFLLAAFAEGRNTVLLIDEAQDLDSGVLESLRLLSNLETSRDKILQIVLCGQPELARRLGQPSLRQLKQRIAVRCRLEPLRRGELPDYVATRTRIAGASNSLFDESCMPAIWEFSGGIPRLVNMACDNALLVAYALGKRSVDAGVLEEVVHDLSQLDVMDLHEDFLDPGGPARPPGTATVPPPVEIHDRPGPAPDAGPTAPQAAPPVASTATPPSAGEQVAPRVGRNRIEPAPGARDHVPEAQARATSVRWIPWVGLGGVLLGALLASVLIPRRDPPVAPTRKLESFPAPSAGGPPAAAAIAPVPLPDPSTPLATVQPEGPPATSTPGSASAHATSTATPNPTATLRPAESTRPAAGEPAIPPAVPGTASPGPSPSPSLPSSALGPLEDRRAMVRRGDTLSNLAKEVYGTENLTLLDILGRSNPTLVDLDHIEPGQTIFFPEPRPDTRMTGSGENATLLVVTTRDRVAAERIRGGLPPGLLGRATVEPGRLGSLRVYRVVVRDLGSDDEVRQASERLGPIFGPGSPDPAR